MRRVGTIAHVVMMALFMSGAAAQTASVPEARLKAIYAMTPQQMAETGQWTKQAYDRMLGYINNIQDKGPPRDKSYSGTTAYPYFNIFNFNGYGRAFWLEYRIDLGAGK